MTSPEAGTTFAEATALKRLSSHEYEANFVDDWCIGSGKLCYCAVRCHGLQFQYSRQHSVQYQFLALQSQEVE